MSLASDIRLNFLFTATERREVFDFGIDNEFPGNPFVFISEVGQHSDFPDRRVLLYHPDGELKLNSWYTLLHNEKGVYHKVNYRKRTKQLFLFNRRDDLERLNLPPSTPEPETSTRASRVFGKQRFIPSRQGSPALPHSPQPTKPPSPTGVTSFDLSPLQLLQQSFEPAGEPPKTLSSPSTIIDTLDLIIRQTPIQTATSLPITPGVDLQTLARPSIPKLIAQQQSSSSTLAATGNLNPTSSSGGGGGGGSSGGGGGGGGGSGGGGGGGGGGGSGRAAAAAGGANANAKLLGGEPKHFEGNRRDVDRFLADLITYIDLNSQNPVLASFKTRVKMALSFMSGETIRHWKKRMLDWARPLAMADDQALWDQFLVQFRAEYADTQ